MTAEMVKIGYELTTLHSKLAERENASSMTIVSGKQLGLNWFQSLGLALGTLGEFHAPIRQTFRLMGTPSFEYTLEHLPGKVPGWGSSWYKEPDPLIEDYIRRVLGDWEERLFEMTTHVQIFTGKNLWPNAAAVTAMSVHKAGMGATWAEQMLVAGRLPVWERLYNGA